MSDAGYVYGDRARCDAQWFALRTRPQQEKVVHERLGRLGFERLLPLTTRRHQWSDRKKTLHLPLFPGYCFARFSREERLAVLQTPGIVTIMGNVRGPEAIPDDEIEAIRRLYESPLAFGPHPYLNEGSLVEICMGPLAGVRGRLIRHGNSHHVVIAVNLIQQAAAVTVDETNVKIVRPELPAAGIPTAQGL